ncbi:hypothetical protein BX666DRAFT_128167 [Dichotomocladium elegans]|nr:hypothetical protein BX666DRAFT_128167 [Dichotomocladium elegans]
MKPSSDFAYILDTSTMTWIDQASAIRPGPNGAAVSTQQVSRCLHQSVLVGEDSLFILQGRVDSGNFASTWLILNTTSWELSNSFPGLSPQPAMATNNTEAKAPSEAENSDEHSALSGGAIGGIVVGVVVAVNMKKEHHHL